MPMNEGQIAHFRAFHAQLNGAVDASCPDLPEYERFRIHQTTSYSCFMTCDGDFVEARRTDQRELARARRVAASGAPWGPPLVRLWEDIIAQFEEARNAPAVPAFGTD